MKTLSIVKFVFTIVGLGFLLTGGFIGVRTLHFRERAVEAEGKVVELVRTRSSNSSSYLYYPVIKFRTLNEQNVEYQSSHGSSPPSYSVGEAVQILYDPSKPQNASINSFVGLWSGTFVLGGLGVIFFSIGFGITLAGMLKKREKEFLLRNGQLIFTAFKGVELNKGYTENGRSPFRIQSQWQNPASQEIHVFLSDNLWFDPTEYVKQESIQVRIDPGNPKRYNMDVSFLPKMA